MMTSISWKIKGLYEYNDAVLRLSLWYEIPISRETVFIVTQGLYDFIIRTVIWLTVLFFHQLCGRKFMLS